MCKHRAFQAAFVEETLLSHIVFPAPCQKIFNHMFSFTSRICSVLFCSVGLRVIFVPEPYCFGYYNFVMQSEIRKLCSRFIISQDNLEIQDNL